jgi:hypothetical protein
LNAQSSLKNHVMQSDSDESLIILTCFVVMLVPRV